MGKTVTLTCDICSTKINPQDTFSNFVGTVSKMDENMKLRKAGFEGFYCSKCTDFILGEITKLKNANTTTATKDKL